MVEVKQILGDISELQKYIVLPLKANSASSKGSNWFQNFDSDMCRCWNESEKGQLNELEMNDVISKSGNKVLFSPSGSSSADELQKNIPKEHLEMISEFRYLLNSSSDDESLTFIHDNFP